MKPINRNQPLPAGFQKCKRVQKSRIRQIRPNNWRQLAGVSSVNTGKPGLAFSFFLSFLVLSYLQLIMPVVTVTVSNDF